MTDLEALEAEAEAMARERADSRTPAIVRRAFLPPFGAITPRRLMELEEINSPLLLGQWPWDDPAAMAQAFCKAYAILFPGREIPPPSQMDVALLDMLGEVKRAFEAFMPMRSPSLPGVSLRTQTSDGIGWLPRLLALAHKNNLPDPLDTPLDQLFILSAAVAANDGKECAGADYRDRKISAAGESDSTAVTKQPDDQTADECRQQDDHRHGPEQSSPQMSTAHVVDTRNEQVELGGHTHGGNLP